MSSAARVPRLVGPALLALVVSGCPEDTLGTTPPAAVDVSGTWTGGWEQDVDEDPLTGTIFLTLLQQSAGRVEGTIALGNISCLGTHAFTGTVSGLTLNGLIEEEGLRVTFLVDLDNVDGEFPDLTGTFQVEEGLECSVTEAMFDADLQIGSPEPPPDPPPDPPPGAPATDDGSFGSEWRASADLASSPQSPPGGEPQPASAPLALAPWADLGGAWRGVARADEDEPRAVDLTLLQAPDGTLSGLLALDPHPPRPFLGALRGPLLLGVAGEEPALRLEARLAVDPLTGRSRLAGRIRADALEETPETDAAFELSRVEPRPAPRSAKRQ